ncbi:DUF479 domain-containing protein, partial [bacterium]|nr:DUF479 domain-containing protein [bacterium]
AVEFYDAMALAHHLEIKTTIEDHFEKPLPGVENHFRIFLQERFLASYDSLSEIVHAMNRVIQRTRQEPLPTHFVEVLTENVTVIEKHLRIFLDEIKTFEAVPNFSPLDSR